MRYKSTNLSNCASKPKPNQNKKTHKQTNKQTNKPTPQKLLPNWCWQHCERHSSPLPLMKFLHHPCVHSSNLACSSTVKRSGDANQETPTVVIVGQYFSTACRTGRWGEPLQTWKEDFFVESSCYKKFISTSLKQPTF